MLDCENVALEARRQKTVEHWLPSFLSTGSSLGARGRGPSCDRGEASRRWCPSSPFACSSALRSLWNTPQVRASGPQTYSTGAWPLRCESLRVRFLEFCCSFKRYPINKSLSRALVLVKDGLGRLQVWPHVPRAFCSFLSGWHLRLLCSRDTKAWWRKKLSTMTGLRKELRDAPCKDALGFVGRNAVE